MALGARRAVVDHDALRLEVEHLLVVAVGRRRHGRLLGRVVGVRPRAPLPQNGVRPHAHGEAHNVAAGVVLLDALDGLGKAVGAVPDDVQHRLAGDLGGGRADDVLPRGRDVADLAVEIEVHDDVQAVLGGLLQVLALLAHVLADGALHGDAAVVGGRPRGLLLEGGDGGGQQRGGLRVVGHGGGRLLRVHSRGQRVRMPSVRVRLGPVAAGIRAVPWRVKVGLGGDDSHNHGNGALAGVADGGCSWQGGMLKCAVRSPRRGWACGPAPDGYGDVSARGSPTAAALRCEPGD
jgi:hypothetical protein